MSLCYLHDVPLLTVRGKTACPACGTLYPTLPADGPFCSVSARLPGGLGVTSSPPLPAGSFYSQNPAQDREQTGGLSGTCHGRNIEPYDAPPVTQLAPALLAARADAAPGRFTPQQAGRGTYTGDVR